MESEQAGGRRIALVIGSGGAKCAAALGLWQVLAEQGIQVSRVIGSSCGRCRAVQFLRTAQSRYILYRQTSIMSQFFRLISLDSLEKRDE